MNTNDESLIREVLDSRNSIVKIDANDVRNLFQEGGEIHAYNASVDASMKKRMELLMDLIIVNTKMEELKPFSDWIESVPGELRIKWGMATQSTQELRAIVLLQ